MEHQRSRGAKTPRDLEERLVDFAVRVLNVVDALPNNKAANHVAGQLLRSGTSPAPNYGEAQSAESRRDFLHKLKIALKELRETSIWLKMIQRKGMLSAAQMSEIATECNELIAIFVKSIKTAEQNDHSPASSSASGLQKSKINNQQSSINSSPPHASPISRTPR